MSDAYAPGYDLEQPGPTRDRRIMVLLLWVLVLYGVAVVFSRLTYGRLAFFSYSFSARASVCYLVCAVIPMLIISMRNFPVAAGLFYAFLPMSEAGSILQSLLGGPDGAITYEMALAIPLIIAGIFGPRAERARRLPAGLLIGFGLIAVAGLLSTAFAKESRSIAAYSLFGKILLPLLVSLAVYRRCRNLADLRVIWWALLFGFAATTAFSYNQITTGEATRPYANQRSISTGIIHGLCLLSLAGSCLWYGYSLAKSHKTWTALFLFIFVGFCGMMIWISATRGNIMALMLLVLVWIIGHAGSMMLRPRLLLTFAGGAIVIVLIVMLTQSWTSGGGIGRAAIDWKMAIERMAGGQAFQSQSRVYIWSVALNEWEKSPVWGIGVNNWVMINRDFASTHSWVIGLLVDLGVLGFVAYMLVFIYSTAMSFRKRVRHLHEGDRAFLRGLRGGWLALLLALSVEVPFTSGQPYLSVLSYLVFLFPLASMIAYTQLGQATPENPEEGLALEPGPQLNEVARA